MRLPGFASEDGAVIAHAGRYAREAVLVAFEMIGGTHRLADWADRNPGEFFTKLLPKVITREVELSTSSGIEELLHQLDSRPAIPPGEAHTTIDAECEVIE